MLIPRSRWSNAHHVECTRGWPFTFLTLLWLFIWFSVSLYFFLPLFIFFCFCIWRLSLSSFCDPLRCSSRLARYLDVRVAMSGRICLVVISAAIIRASLVSNRKHCAIWRFHDTRITVVAAIDGSWEVVSCESGASAKLLLFCVVIQFSR